MNNVDKKLAKGFLYFFWIWLFFTITANASSWCNSSRLNRTEQTICNSISLRQLDTELAQVYGNAKAEKQDYDQLSWLKNSRNACDTNVICLKREYRSRIRILKSRIENRMSQNNSDLHKYDASDVVGVPATMVEIGNSGISSCRIAISDDGEYFFLKKVNSKCKNLTNSKGYKIICNPNKTLCKTRNELIDYIGAQQKYKSKDKNKDTVRVEFDYKVAGNKVYLEVDIYNYYKRYTRGGLTVSFPQFSNRSQVMMMNSRGFESVNKYPKYSRIYNKDSRSEMSAKYLLVEGWSDHWNSSAKRSIKLAIDAKYLSELVVNIRGVARKNNTTVHIPTMGPYDQQGYHSKRIVINLENSSAGNSSSTSSKYVNTYSGECSDSSKPVLACSPDERDQKAFTMCAISMGGCAVAVQQINNTNDRYLASQACSALSSELMGQKYTLDDMLGTFFVDAMSEEAKSQFDKGNTFFGFLLAAGTAVGKSVQLEQCVQNAKRNCTKEYNEWRHKCR